MNWDALAAVAELAGALVVVVTLVYVATELRGNTKALRRSAADSALAAVLDFTSDMARDKEVSQLLTQGSEDWDGLSESDRARLVYVLFRCFKVLENIHYYYSLGILDEETWAGWKSICLMYAQSKAGRFYLGARREFFSRRFLEMIDSEVSLGERIIPTKGLAQMGAERRSPEPTPGAESPASRDA
jgi:hypothetical protein